MIRQALESAGTSSGRGAVPLEVLSGVVDEWIAKGK
jgi:hypothetical protein